MKNIFVLFLFFSFTAIAMEDPTQGKSFFPWVWQDQLKPTLQTSFDQTGLMIIGTGAVSTAVVHQYDHKIDTHLKEDGKIMDPSLAKNLGIVGNGVLWVGIGGLQLFVDQPNGLATLRALLLTSISHVSMSAVVKRDRPENPNESSALTSSFPSGHTASAFAFAGSMAYAYGWKGGVPAYAVATAVGLSRLQERMHWASDIVAGAFLGTFWARAAFAADKVDRESFYFVPVPVNDGMLISALKEF